MYKYTKIIIKCKNLNKLKIINTFRFYCNISTFAGY